MRIGQPKGILATPTAQWAEWRKSTRIALGRSLVYSLDRSQAHVYELNASIQSSFNPWCVGPSNPLSLFDQLWCGKGVTQKVFETTAILSALKKTLCSRLLQWSLFRFLDAFSHLYKRVCPSVRPSVRRSVRRSVGPSQTSWNRAKSPFLTKIAIDKGLKQECMTIWATFK